ncbi:hypothetical protein [Bacillus sp. SA1-12]|uniref:hypothetical protein n=1 Tax=Bacillus sp. SA1-12 TaxID=1455638 RepID=UPI000B29AAE5|nr:hypothetical protein [Bacillus sp. SA1-12]
MLDWWLATISLVGLLLISIGLFLYTLKNAVNADDAYRIDPSPNENRDDKK